MKIKQITERSIRSEDWENDTPMNTAPTKAKAKKKEIDPTKGSSPYGGMTNAEFRQWQKQEYEKLSPEEKAKHDEWQKYRLTPDQDKADDDGEYNHNVRSQNTIRTASRDTTGKDSKFHRKATSTTDVTAIDPTTGKKSYTSSIDSTSTADQDRNTVWHRTATTKNHLTGKGNAVVDGDKDTQTNRYGGDHDAIDMIRQQEKDIASLRTKDTDDEMDAIDAKIDAGIAKAKSKKVSEDWENDTPMNAAPTKAKKRGLTPDEYRQWEKQEYEKLSPEEKAMHDEWEKYGGSKAQVDKVSSGNSINKVSSQITDKHQEKGGKVHSKRQDRSDVTNVDAKTGKDMYSVGDDYTEFQAGDERGYAGGVYDKNHETGKGYAEIEQGSNGDEYRNAYGGDNDTIDMIRKQQQDIADLRAQDVDDLVGDIDDEKAKIAKAKSKKVSEELESIIRLIKGNN